MKCILCGGEKGKKVYAPPSIGTRALTRCLACGLLQMDPMPTTTDLASYYQHYDVLGEREPYYAGLWGEHALASPEGRDVVARTAWLLKIYTPKKVLDVGSGPGLFLRLMKEKGIWVEGVELNSRAAKRSSEEIGVPVHAGTLESLPAASYDCITLWDLIEHVNDPRALLKDVAAKLSPGDWLFIETPNESSLLDRLVLFLVQCKVRTPANTFYGMHHLVLFRKTTLRTLLESHGFSVVEMRGVQTTVSRIFRTNSIKDVLMRFGLGTLFLIGRVFGMQNKMLVAARYEKRI